MPRSIAVCATWAVLLAAGWCSAQQSSPVMLRGGDIVVAAVNAGGVVYRVDPATGREAVLGWLRRDVRDIALALDERGQVFVAYAVANSQVGWLVRMNPVTGEKKLIAMGPPMKNPVGLALDGKGKFWVADAEAAGGKGGIVRIEPGLFGEQRLLPARGPLRRPLGISLAPDGDLLVADPAAAGGAAILRVNPTTGAQTNISSGGSLRAPVGVVASLTNALFVADAQAFDGYGWVLRVDPKSGDQTKLCSGGRFREPQAVAVGGGGDLFVVDRGAFGGRGGIIRVNARNGREVAAWPGGAFNDPRSIAVVPGSQPDAMIHRGFIFGCDGNNIYNRDGAGQTRTQEWRPGQTRTFLIRVQNDGRFTDSFVVKGSSEAGGFAAQYLAGEERGRDLTSEVVRGIALIRDLAPGASVSFRIEVGLESHGGGSGPATFTILVASVADPTKRDTVKAVITGQSQ
ncbi:MAG: hypothetical protein HZA91_17845 [Verrucomicrobia bacterium]|nr:hypothetical protein [Verrucomicrobiota bacterium]